MDAASGPSAEATGRPGMLGAIALLVGESRDAPAERLRDILGATAQLCHLGLSGEGASLTCQFKARAG